MEGSVQEGRYRIVRKLGEGGQGEVYLVEHLHLGRTEALKVLKAQYARDENFVSRFRREARATNRVQHPNIVGVYDFGRLSDGRYFLEAETVAKIVRKPDDAVDYQPLARICGDCLDKPPVELELIAGDFGQVRQTGLPGAEKTVHMLEVKTSSDKLFKVLQKEGVEKAKPEHFAQMQIYMKWSLDQFCADGCKRALYVCDKVRPVFSPARVLLIAEKVILRTMTPRLRLL